MSAGPKGELSARVSRQERRQGQSRPLPAVMRMPQREPTANQQPNRTIAIPEFLRVNRTAHNKAQPQAKTRANKLGSRRQNWRKVVFASYDDLFFPREWPNCPCTKVYPTVEEVVISEARPSPG